MHVTVLKKVLKFGQGEDIWSYLPMNFFMSQRQNAAQTTTSHELWKLSLWQFSKSLVTIPVDIRRNNNIGTCIMPQPRHRFDPSHYSDVTISARASQITSLTIVYSTIYSGAYQRKHHSSASLAFFRGIHRWPVNSPHKGPVTRKMFPFDDVIMNSEIIPCHHWDKAVILTTFPPQYIG